MKSGKDSQIPRPVGALIKLLGYHSRMHMVSETMPSSLHFCLLFCFEGQRVDCTHPGSHRCGENATSAVGRVSAPLEQERTDWEPAFAGVLLCLICFRLHPLRVGREPLPKAPSLLPALRLKGGAAKRASESEVLNGPWGETALAEPLR